MRYIVGAVRLTLLMSYLLTAADGGPQYWAASKPGLFAA